MKVWRTVQGWYHNFFNPKFAVPSAIFNGGIVAMINGEYGFSLWLKAGCAQAASSFLSTGITARVVQHFSPVENPWIAYPLGSLVPGAMTFVMSLTAHLWNQTPDPFVNALPATFISLTTSVVTNFITRRGYLRPSNYPKGS